MLKREMTAVVWHERGHRIEVTYVEGDPDFFEGDELVISQMAENEGMWLIPSVEGTRRWVRP
jgi:hypothetical protein